MECQKTASLPVLEHYKNQHCILEKAKECIVITDQKGTVLACNHSCEKMFGYIKSELFKRTVKQMIHPEYRDRWVPFKRQIDQRGHVFFEGIAVRKDGTPLPIEFFGIPIVYGDQPAVLNIIRNNIERKKIEFSNHSRLNMLNEMASSLAHELNQPISAIVNYSQGCIRRLVENSYKPEELIIAIERVIKQAERAAEIIQRLRGFVCYGQLKYARFDLNDAIREAINLLISEYQSLDIKIRTHLSVKVPKIYADKIQIEQMIINIIKNAIEAVQNCQPKNKIVHVETQWKENGFIEILVCDRGVGVDKKTMKHMFDPFFTTKAQGMGLGLAISRTIIEAHGGKLSMTLDAKKGTCFQVKIPIEQRG